MSGGKKYSFQVQLSGEWKDYDDTEHAILTKAYMSGYPTAKYKLRGQGYIVDFKKGEQKNANTGKTHRIRPPYNKKPPDAPVLPSGKVFSFRVPPGTPGKTIYVDHPLQKDVKIAVNVPADAKVGQEMMIPIPKPEDETPIRVEPVKPDSSDATPDGAPAAPGKPGWSTGTKVAAGTAAVVGIGGLAIGGVILGEHIAEEGWDATAAEIGDAATAAGEGIADGAEAAVDWAGDAADTAGDFIMDLF